MSRHLPALGWFCAALSLAAAMPTVSAAQNRQPDPNATRMIVGVFQSADKNLGVQAQNSLRSRLRTDLPWKEVYVLVAQDYHPLLEASGFPTNEPLAAHDMRALAVQVRVEQYIVGAAQKTSSGFRMEPRLVLTRDPDLVQPLGVHEGNNLLNTSTSVSKELKEARKQLEGEQACVNNAREGKYDEAAAAARAGIAAYQKATLARICLASVLVAQKAPADELLKVTREIVALDPRSRHGLTYLAQAYQDLDMGDSVVVTLTRLLQTNPTDAELVARTIETIAASTNPRAALPIIEEAVKENPSSPDLLRLRWQLLGASREYKQMFAAGEELISLDTSMADTSYFMTTTLAYTRDSQPQKAAETASKGVAKFPNHAGLIYVQVAALRSAGQSQQALEALNRAMEAKIAVDDAAVLRLTLLRDLGRNDEVLPAAKQLIAAGDTSSNVRAIVINAANDAFRQAQQSTDVSQWEPVLAAALYADSVALGEQKLQSQFILGAVYAVFGGVKLNAANEAKNCEMAKESKNMLVEAQIMLPKGGAFAPDAMRALMGNVMRLDPVADQVIGAYCRSQ